MTSQAVPVSTISDADVSIARDAVHRFLTARVRDRHLVDDVCQEAIARLLQARDRLDASSATPYAITVAKSILVGEARKADVARRHHHRLDRGTPPPSPEELAMQQSDASAITAALAALPVADRRELVAHVVEGEPTAALAARSSGTPGGIAARLARSRARMRVDYLVAARGLTLPSEDCHAVLMALSAGDRRRQRSLQAAEHLGDCETCTDLAPPLVERQRSMVALVPIPALAVFFGRLRAGRRSTQALAVSSAVAMAVVAAVVVTANAPHPTHRAAARVAPIAASTTVVTRQRVTAVSDRLLLSGEPAGALLRGSEAGDYRGRSVTAQRVRVQSVPADEGFWIDGGRSGRVWVQLVTGGAESRVQVRAGNYVSFTGVVRPHGRNFPTTVGVTRRADAEALALRVVHLETDANGLRIGPR